MSNASMTEEKQKKETAPPADTSFGAAAHERPVPRISIEAFSEFPDTIAALQRAAGDQIPILMLMHNNRAYHNELIGIQRTASRRSRGVDRVHLCARIEEPFIDYAKVAQGLGVRAEGPIEDPALLAGAIRRGIEAVKSGEPYLIDTITQPR